MLSIAAGFAGLAALALAAPEPLPDRTREPFAWQPVEPLTGWPLPQVEPEPPPRPSIVTPRYDLVQTPALVRTAQALHDWRPDPEWGGDPQTFAIGDIRVTLGGAEKTVFADTNDAEWRGAVVMVEAPGMAPWRARRDDVQALVWFGVGLLDAARPGPQVLIGFHTGGMRCCLAYSLLTPENGRWRETSLEEVVENSMLEGMIDWPTDLDGDGRPEWVFSESNTNYMGEVWQPPVYLQVHDGKVANITDRRSLRPHLRARMNEAEADCRKHDNRACATLVLMAGKLGGEERAWRVLMENYDRQGPFGTDFPGEMLRYRSDGAMAWR